MADFTGNPVDPPDPVEGHDFEPPEEEFVGMCEITVEE